MTAAIDLIKEVVSARWRRLALWGAGLAAGFQIFLMLSLIVRFAALPNYIVFYDWPGNVWRIIRSTPSVWDMGPIIAEEWLIEIGFMNYDFGNGISEWSLNVVPYNLLVLFILGALVGLIVELRRSGSCAVATSRSAGAATGLGAVLVLMTNATLSWVVCCATPSWVVGLAIMGVGVSTSLALETLGPWLGGLGFGSLLAGVAGMAWSRSRVTAPSLTLSEA